MNNLDTLLQEFDIKFPDHAVYVYPSHEHCSRCDKDISPMNAKELPISGYATISKKEIEEQITKAYHLGLVTGAERMAEGVEYASYHYWRECHKCGHADGGYLHCMHDGYQNSCHKCGERMETVEGDCDCEFVTNNDDILSILSQYK